MTGVESFERDVLDCGVPLGDARALGKRYERALKTRSCIDWIELYVGVFATLLRSAHGTRVADPMSAERLLRLLSDDLGADLFDGEALENISHHLHGWFRAAS